MGRTLCLVLGDQLSLDLPSLKAIDKKSDVVLMCEVWQEATYVKHHKKKIAFLFSAMRHFAKLLKENGWKIDYQVLDTETDSTFTSAVERAIKRYGATQLVVTMPGEYRVWAEIQEWRNRFDTPVEILEDTRFICSIDEFKEWAEGRKQLRMEYFYRVMRKKMDILVEKGKPVGGKWNYDSDNRKPPDEHMHPPEPLSFEGDEITEEVLKLVSKHFGDHFGDLHPFKLAVTREQVLKVLNHFVEYRLSRFGDYQDAMIQGQPLDVSLVD